MACISPASFAAALCKYVTENNWGFQYLTADKESYSRGVAYYLIPYRRAQRNTLDIWFKEALPPKIDLECDDGDHHSPGFISGRAYVIIRWFRFLQPAFDVNNGRQPMAWMALRFFKEAIRPYDPILAEDLTVYTRLADVPLDALERLNIHLDRLLQSDAGIALLKKTFQDSMCEPHPTGINDYFHSFSLEKRHQLFEKYVSVFNPRTLRDRIPRLAHNVAEPTIPTQLKGWPSVARHILSGTGGIDGSYSIKLNDDGGYIRLVNWRRLMQIAASKPLDNTLLAHLSVFFSLDDLAKQAMDARQAFNKAVGPEVFYSRKRHQLHELAAQQGVTDVPLADFDLQWDAYYSSALGQYTHNWDLRSAGYQRFLATQRQHVVKPIDASEWNYKIVYSTYQGDKIGIVRRRLSSPGVTKYDHYFTVPYKLPPGYDIARHRAHVTVTVKGNEYWSIRGISRHASRRQAHRLDPAIEAVPEAAAFRDWAINKARELDGAAFNKQLFEQQLSKRRLEFRDGTRKHLGPFTTEEDGILRAFFESRKPGSLRPIERGRLADLLPGRSFQSLVYRLFILGFKYARLHGWVAYTKSGYFIRASAKRRKQWLKEGVPL